MSGACEQSTVVCTHGLWHVRVWEIDTALLVLVHVDQGPYLAAASWCNVHVGTLCLPKNAALGRTRMGETERHTQVLKAACPVEPLDPLCCNFKVCCKGEP